MKTTLNDFRSQSLFFITIAIALIFGGRLFYLQVLKGDYYKSAALSAQQKKFEIPASRGQIYIKDGNQTVPIVLNETVATVFADPSFVYDEDVDETATEISNVLGIEANEVKAKLQSEDSSYEVIAKKIDSALGDQVQALGLRGIGVQSSEARVYPEGSTAAQVLGFVDNDGFGQYGLEQAIDERLAGKAGQLKAVTDINGVPLPTSEGNIQLSPVAGDKVTLTLDRNVQQFVETALQEGVELTTAKSASAVVIDPNTGKVMAMANYPTFDPAEFSQIEDLSVFTNDVITGAYESGSVVKSVTMAAGLNEGIVNPNTVYYDSGQKNIDDRVITNAGFTGGFDRTMTEVIQKSVNTGVVHVLEQIGGGFINDKAKDVLHEYFTDRFGFGSPTGITLSGEANGTIISPEDEQGNAVRYANMSFGQGMSVTMIQMVAAYSALVNGGDYYTPQIVESFENEKGEVAQIVPNVVREGLISDVTSEQIRDMMNTVVDNGGGFTAKREGYDIGGKSGSAQIPDEFGGYYEDKYIGSFIGFGATNDTEYIIMTRVDEPNIVGYAGSSAAAPIFSNISNYLIDYFQLSPDQEGSQ